MGPGHWVMFSWPYCKVFIQFFKLSQETVMAVTLVTLTHCSRINFQFWGAEVIVLYEFIHSGKWILGGWIWQQMDIRPIYCMIIVSWFMTRMSGPRNFLICNCSLYCTRDQEKWLKMYVVCVHVCVCVTEYTFVYEREKWINIAFLRTSNV